MKRWEVINHFASRFKNARYLEIGIHEGENWLKINAPIKVGVDPFPRFKSSQIKTLTSDAFFEENEQTFDVVFIDGLHEKEQFKRDVYNALRCISSNGVIICHDCAPTKESETQWPRHTKSGRWLGNVYIGWIELRSELELTTYTIDTDEGLGVIEQIEQKPLEIREPIKWINYVTFRNKWLNLVSVEAFKEFEK